MEDQQIDGLPEGVTLRPVQPASATADSSQVEGLPEGVTLRPVTPPVPKSAPKAPTIQHTAAPTVQAAKPSATPAIPVNLNTADEAYGLPPEQALTIKAARGARGMYHGLVGDEATPEITGKTSTASPVAENAGFTPENIGYNVGKMGHGIYEFGKEAVKDIAGNEPIVIPDKGDKASFADPKAHTLVAKYVTAPSMAERQASQDEFQKYFETKGPAAAGHAISAFLHGTLGEYVPAVGPLVMALEEQAQKGDIGGALSQLASLYAFEKGTGAVKEGIKDRVNAKVADLTKSPETKQAEANVESLGKEREAAQQKLDTAQAKHQQYAASHRQGIGSPEKVTNEVNKAQQAYDEAEAHHELAKEELAKTKTVPQRVGGAAGRAVAKVLPTPAPAPEIPTEDVQAAPVLGKLGEKTAPAKVLSPINVKTPGQVQPETFPQEPKPTPRPSYGRIALPNEQGTMGKPLQLTEGTPEGPQVPKGGLPKINLPEEKPAVAPKPEVGNVKALKAENGKVVDKEETIEGRVGKLLQDALKPEAKKEAPTPETKNPEAPAEKRSNERRVSEEALPEGQEERRQTERRVLQGINNRTFQESAFGTGGEKRIDTDAYAKASEQARKELGPNASKEAVIARRNELVEPGAKGSTGDLGAKARETNPEPTRAETKGVTKPKEVLYRGTNSEEANKIEESGKITPDAFSSGHLTPDKATAEAYAKANGGKVYTVDAAHVPEKDMAHYRETGRGPITLSSEVPTVEHAGRLNLPKEEDGYAAKKEEVVPTGAEGREPAKSAAEYHPAVQQKVNELSDESLRKLATAHGLNPNEYDFKARDAGRHRVERDQLAKDITEQLGEDEKINLGRAAEQAEREPGFANREQSAKARADRAEKLFPRLRGPVDQFGNPKVSGGAPDTVGTKEAADRDNEHFANAKKELGANASISEIAKRAQELKDTAKEGASAKDDYDKEKAFSQQVLSGEKKVEDFPYYDSYKKTIDAESKQLKPGSKILFVGGGPMPVSSIEFARKGFDTDTMELDPETTKIGQRVADKSGVNTGKFITSDARTFDKYKDYDAVVVALEAGPEGASKNAVIKQVMDNVKPGTKVLARGTAGAGGETFVDTAKNLPKGVHVANSIDTFDGLSKTHTLESTDQHTANLHNENGGSSVHPEKGNLAGKDGYSVSVDKSLEHIVDKPNLTAEDVKSYKEKPAVKTALDKSPNSYVGTWRDGDKSYLDVSQVEPSLEKARKLAQDNKQLAVFDLKNMKEIKTTNAKGSPVDEFGNPTASGGSQSSGENKRTMFFDPDKLTPKKEELENAKLRMRESGKTPIEWAKEMKAKNPEPIKVTHQNGTYTIEDGHHRYLAATLLNDALKAEVTDKPSTRNAKGSPVDEFGNPTVSGGAPEKKLPTGEIKRGSPEDRERRISSPGVQTRSAHKS